MGFSDSTNRDALSFIPWMLGLVSSKILVDGSIKYQESEGSIHKVAAKIIGAESCNGWTFWHYQSGNSLKPIDAVSYTHLTLPTNREV